MATHDFAELAGKIAPLASRPVTTITPDLTISDLALDSMGAVELVADLQEDYDILLSRQDLEQAVTLGELAELIWSRLPGAAGNESLRG
jgi:acyl carrier protein